MDELWSATLDPNSPRYEQWKEILGSDNVPIKSPNAHKVKLGDTEEDEVYLLDLNKFSPESLDKLVAFVRERFKVEEEEVRTELAVRGFPIREADVIVAFSLRAFL